MAHEDFVLYGHALADEGVIRYFAALPDSGSSLDLNEGADARVITYVAAIEVYEVANYHSAPILHRQL